MSDKTYVLVQTNDNWADEMDIDGLYVTTADEHRDFIDNVNKYFEHNDSINYCVGSNEDINYESAEDLLSCYEVVCSDLYACGLGTLEFANFLPSGFCGPEIEDFEFQDKNDE